jgi:hypothetical protein
MNDRPRTTAEDVAVARRDYHAMLVHAAAHDMNTHDTQVGNLDDEQHARYEEAIRCGATHEDALEAAILTITRHARRRTTRTTTRKDTT